MAASRTEHPDWPLVDKPKGKGKAKQGKAKAK
jgi:hypothetical protein